MSTKRGDRLGLGRAPQDDDDDDDYRGSGGGGRGSAGARPWLYLAAVMAVLGAVFAAFSSADFIAHLDRQMHSIHCSFIPGAGREVGESGCRTVMMSPYSSLFRGSMWGGLPISLLAFAVFSYLGYRTLDFALKRSLTKKDTLFLVVATGLPVVMSLIYGYISMELIGSVCKLCVGVYVTSFGVAIAAVIAHLKADTHDDSDVPQKPAYARWFLEGVAYVAVLVLVYMLSAPTNDKTLDGCGTLAKKDDPAQILLKFGGPPGSAPAISVLDPLCPACKAFDNRLVVSGLDAKLNMDVVLFPLDKTCNWNVKESLHPGACAVSEAMLCSKAEAKKILAWAFEHQEELIAEAKADEPKMRARIEAQFPSVKGCLGTNQARNKVTKSLKWAVANALPVLTPQLFIGDRRVCDEDTDLGLEYTITAMLSRGGR
jgi:uncharacterized membrane protein